MPRVSIYDTTLQAIANAIRNKKSVSTQYKPSDMATAIDDITTSGLALETGTITPVSRTQTLTIPTSRKCSFLILYHTSPTASIAGRCIWSISFAEGYTNGTTFNTNAIGSSITDHLSVLPADAAAMKAYAVFSDASISVHEGQDANNVFSYNFIPDEYTWIAF